MLIGSFYFFLVITSLRKTVIQNIKASDLMYFVIIILVLTYISYCLCSTYNSVFFSSDFLLLLFIVVNYSSRDNLCIFKIICTLFYSLKMLINILYLEFIIVKKRKLIFVEIEYLTKMHA